MESVLILNRTTRSKKLEVKGGFYSKEDMKSELGYSQPLASKLDRILYVSSTAPADLAQPSPSKPTPRSRVEKSVAWAEKKGLLRPLD